MKHFPANIYDMKKTDSVGGLTITQPSKTNRAGAMTKKQQIKRLMAQGQINAAWANGMFPGDGDIPDDFVPPDYQPDQMAVLDEARAVVKGHNEGAARAIAKKKMDERGAADDIKAQHHEADKDTRDQVERAPDTTKVPE